LNQFGLLIAAPPEPPLVDPPAMLAFLLPTKGEKNVTANRLQIVTADGGGSVGFLAGIWKGSGSVSVLALALEGGAGNCD